MLLQLGFYTETKDDRQATIIKFLPLTSQLFLQQQQQGDGQPPQIDMVAATQFLVITLAKRSEDVFSLPKCDYNLENMKQDAMVHYWFSEVGLEDF